MKGKEVRDNEAQKAKFCARLYIVKTFDMSKSREPKSKRKEKRLPLECSLLENKVKRLNQLLNPPVKDKF